MTQKHAILGFGVTGQSVARHLLANAKECVVFDTRPSRFTPKEFEQLAIHWQIADWSKPVSYTHLTLPTKRIV